MKILSLLLWVTQFGLSIIFPIVFFLMSAVWLQTRFGLGIWITLLFGILGALTSFQTAKSCLASLKKAAKEAAGDREQTISFNKHI